MWTAMERPSTPTPSSSNQELEITTDPPEAPEAPKDPKSVSPDPKATTQGAWKKHPLPGLTPSKIKKAIKLKISKASGQQDRRKKIASSLQDLVKGVEEFRKSLTSLINDEDTPEMYNHLRELMSPVNSLSKNIHNLKSSFELDLLKLKSQAK